MTVVDQPGEANDAFVVVINDLGQHSLWRAGVTVPPGWRSRSPALPRSQCLDVVGRSWRDMAPATARGGQCPDGGGFAHERFAEQGTVAEFAPRNDPAFDDPKAFERMSEEEFHRRFGDTALERPGLERMRRNVATARRQDATTPGRLDGTC